MIAAFLIQFVAFSAITVMFYGLASLYSDMTNDPDFGGYHWRVVLPVIGVLSAVLSGISVVFMS